MADYIKDPDAVLDYRFDWTPWLAGSETIVTSTVAATAGINVDSFTNSTTATIVWLSGGTNGKLFNVTNRIVTNQGRTDERSFSVRIRNR